MISMPLQVAFAATPTTELFEANDPDDGDNIFSNGDTILIRFSEATNATNGGTMTPTEFNANFTIAGGITSFDGTFTGTWQTGSTELLITWTTIGSNIPVVGSTTIEEKGTTTIFDAVGAFKYADTPDTLTGDFGLAVGSTIVLYEANDPDDGDTVFSTDDTILIRFSEGINATNGGTMDSTEFAANFTVTSPSSFDGTFSGVWSNPDANGPQDLLLTWTTIGSNTPTVGTTTIDDNAATTNLFDAATTSIKFTENGLDTLTGDFGLFVALNTGSEGCFGDCSPPTLGVDEQFSRVVENGFTYNGDTINVERYFTPYPLITVDVGKQNKAVFKIYDDSGPDNIRHFDLAFGLDVGQYIGTSNAMIVWDKSHDGTETVTLVDPHNALDNVRVLTSEGKCKADSTTNGCLIVTVFHTFREPLEFDMVGTNVWDYNRNPWQNFYNHGIHIEGQSLNPPDEYVGIYKGNPIHIIETGKNTAVDTDGNTWTFDNTWIKDYIHKGKIDDPISSQGYDRNHVRFSTYKQGQELIASSLFEKLYKTSALSQEPAFSEINDIKFYEFPDRIDKKFDPVLQAKMHEEDIRAQKYLEEMFAKMYPGLVYD